MKANVSQEPNEVTKPSCWIFFLARPYFFPISASNSVISVSIAVCSVGWKSGANKA